MITLQFSRLDTIFCKLVAYRTRSWATHVDFVLPDEKLLGAVMYQDGGGVNIRDMSPISSYKQVERYEVDAPDSVIDFAKNQIGKPYDWWGVLNFLAPNRDWQDPSKWFCSELVAASFAASNCPLLRGEAANRVVPGDLLLSIQLKPICLPSD